MADFLKMGPVQRRLLYQLLCLSNNDRERLKKFLEVGFSSSKEAKNLQLLLDYLLKHLTSYKESKLPVSRLYLGIFKHRQPDTRAVNALFEELARQTTIFLATMHLQHAAQESEASLLAFEWLAACENVPETGIENYIKYTERLVTSQPASEQALHQQFRFHHIYFSHPETDLYKHGPMLLIQLAKLHDAYTKTTRRLLDLALHQANNVVLHDVVSSSEHVLLPQLPLYEQLMHIQANSPDDIHAYRSFFIHYVASFPLLALKNQCDLFVILNNDLVRLVSRLPADFTPLLNEVLQWGLEQRNFAVHYMTKDDRFLNIASVLGNAGDCDSMERFINNYGRYIPVNNRKDAKNLALAFLNYYQYRTTKSQKQAAKLADGVKKHLEAIKNRHPKYHLRVYYLYLRLYYEKFVAEGDDENLFKKMDAFENYLASKESYHALQKRCHTFFTFLRQIKKMRTHPATNTAAARRELLDALKKCSPQPIGTDWLGEQINALACL
jgi:hypothetical protein